MYFDSIPSWAHLSSSLTCSRSDAGPKCQLGQGRAWERCWKSERRDPVSVSKMGRTKSRSIPGQLPSPTQAQHMPSPPASRLHPDWRELTGRGAVSLQICRKQHKPRALCGCCQAAKGETRRTSARAPLTPSTPGTRLLCFAPIVLGQCFPFSLHSWASFPAPCCRQHLQTGFTKGVFLPHTLVLSAGRTQI